MVKNYNTAWGKGYSNFAYLIYVKKNVCSMFILKVANIVKLEAILFMLIRWSKRRNAAWEQGKSNSAYPNYAKKSGSQLILRNASRMHISQEWL